MLLSLLLAAATCFTTNIKEFEKDAALACSADRAHAVDVYGKYPGDVVLTMTYDFDLGSKGPRDIAATEPAFDAFRAAVASNVGMRKRYPGVAQYTLVMRDMKVELCRFVFVAGHDAPKDAACAAFVGGK